MDIKLGGRSLRQTFKAATEIATVKQRQPSYILQPFPMSLK
jgi:hypothetical protein